MERCLDCLHCFACVCLADTEDVLTDKKINTICRVMGGFVSRHGKQTGTPLKITESILNDIKEAKHG